MLKTMRRNVKALKPTLWIIIATFIIAIFAIWGGAGRLGESDNAGTLVSIGHERVSSDTYFQTLRQRLEAMKREYPQLDRGLIQQLNVPQQVLQQIVEQSLLLQISRDMKIGAGDEEVRARIVSYPVFQKDGRFIGFEEYKQVLDWNRIPLTEFESGLKKEIAITKVVQLLTAGVAVSDDEVWANYLKQNESAKIEYLVAETGKIEVAEQRPDATPRSRPPSRRTRPATGSPRPGRPITSSSGPTTSRRTSRPIRPRSNRTTGTTSPSSGTPKR